MITVMTNYNVQNGTQDVFDTATTECIKYGSPDDVAEWLDKNHFHQINLSEWHSQSYTQPTQ